MESLRIIGFTTIHFEGIISVIHHFPAQPLSHSGFEFCTDVVDLAADIAISLSHEAALAAKNRP